MHFWKYIDPLLDTCFPNPCSSPSPAAQKRVKTSQVDDSDDDTSDQGDDEGIVIADVMEIGFEDETMEMEAAKNVPGNILLHNNILLWRDLLQYWEFKCSVKEGDTGHTFKVIKVSD